MSVRGLLHTCCVVGLLSLVSLGTPAPAVAASKTIDLAALQQLAAGLGLDDSGDKKTFVRVENQGSQNYTVWLQPADDQTTVLIYTFLDDIPSDKAASAPLEKMLEYNDSHPPYFTISGDDSNKHIFLQYRLAALATTPQALRTSMDSLLQSADDTKELWKADGWKTPAAAMPPAAKAVAVKPFSAETVMFVDQPTNSFGNYHKRATNVFAPGEKLITYIEPIGYDYKTVGADTYQFGVAIDLELKDKAGKSLGNQANFSRQELTSHQKVKEFFLDLTLAINGFPAGDYVAIYTLHDTAGTQTTQVEQPFTIKTASQ